MIQIQSAKLVEGTDYDSWVQVFESQEAIKMRADAGLKILAYGWNAEKERVFTVAEMDDPQTVQKMMQTSEAAAIMAKAGTDKSSMEMIPLPNGKPGIRNS